MKLAEKWKLGRTQQCAKCPWKKGANPHEIPNGYCPIKHAKLKGTIAEEGDLSFLSSGTIRIMACHEDGTNHCVGWLHNQLGEGNNIALRLSMLNCENAGEIKTFGEQHERFEDTLPQ
jgi:hypothetical protein